jgi:hypothetical protein
MSKRETKAGIEAREARAFFERIQLKPGDTVFTILDSVSRSGMSRQVRPVILKDGADFHPTWAVGVLTGRRVKRGGTHDSLTIGGCGFDAGHDLVYSLSHVLYPEGFGCIGEDCPSNDHSNGDRDYTPHSDEVRVCIRCDYAGPCTTCPRCVRPTKDSTQRVEHWHREGGYALRHRWL